MAEATEAARTAGIEAPNPEVAILGFFCLLARMIALYSASDAVAAKTAKVLGRGLPRKQIGARPIQSSPHQESVKKTGYPTRDRKGGDPAEWPEDLRLREMPEGRR